MGKFNIHTERLSSKNIQWDSIGKEPVKVAYIMATRNYKMFRFLDGNRDTKHANKLIKSLMAIGILYQPVLINEKNEIVEGQGRFIAMRELNLPVLYTVQHGIGIKECRFLNSCSTNWGIKNYVHSFSSGADKKISYVYIEQLSKEFPEFGMRIIFSAAVNKTAPLGGTLTATLKSGNVELTDADYERGRKVLSYIKEFIPYLKSVSGRMECMYSALIYCYNNIEVDNDYLLDKFSKRYTEISPIANTHQALAELEKVYNYNIRNHRSPVYLKSGFEKYSRANKGVLKGGT